MAIFWSGLEKGHEGKDRIWDDFKVIILNDLENILGLIKIHKQQFEGRTLNWRHT